MPGSVPTFRTTWRRAASWALCRLAAGCSRAESGTSYRRRVSPKSKLSRLGKQPLGTLPYTIHHKTTAFRHAQPNSQSPPVLK